jgi:predicted transposase/invertase (TIGR01784 family)
MKNITEMKEKFKGDDDYMAAIRKVEDLSTDPNFIGYYDIEEAKRQDLEDMKKTGIRIGIEQGIEQGEKKKQIEFIKESYANGLEIDMISKITKLAKEEITNILNKN